ncbi:MAG: M20/M25/M40 family metallo-hydrolase [Deltaproteobacteria bacterium]|nr:M20/M25/M40 family metallo-hydrolase [Deltaproteobacteria bacterium]
MKKTTETDNIPEPAVQPGRVRKLLEHLINIYSPSGKEEEILEYLYGYLKKQGLPIVRQEVDDSRYNLVVVPPDREIQFVLVGHLDTVAAYDLEDYGYQEDDDTISGLGSADMKSGCAAMVESYLSAWKKTSGRLPVALALVVGEEEEGDGAQALVGDYHFPWAIIGEPTDLQPCLSHYGYVEIQVLTGGKRKHASLANKEQNPVEEMLRLLIEFSNYMEKKRPGLIYNIRDIFSPPAGFVVPDRCEVWIDTHLPPDAPIGEITVEMEEMIEKQRKKNQHLDMALRFTTIHAGYDIPGKGPVVEVLKELYKSHSLIWKPHAFRSHSDASILWEAGIKPIMLGPGKLEAAHAPEESVSFSQVIDAARLYFDLLMSLESTER